MLKYVVNKIACDDVQIEWQQRNNRDTGDVFKKFVLIWFQNNFIQSLQNVQLQTTRDQYFLV